MSNPALLRMLRSGVTTDMHIGRSTRQENPFPLFAGETYKATFSMPASHASMSPAEHAKAMAKMKGGDKKKKEKKGDASSSDDGEKSASDYASDNEEKKPARKKAKKESSGGSY